RPGNVPRRRGRLPARPPRRAHHHAHRGRGDPGARPWRLRRLRPAVRLARGTGRHGARGVLAHAALPRGADRHDRGPGRRAGRRTRRPGPPGRRGQRRSRPRRGLRRRLAGTHRPGRAHRHADAAVRARRVAAAGPAAARPGQDRHGRGPDLLLAWLHAFQAEGGPEGPDPAGRVVSDQIGYGGLILWEHEGRPVSVAGRNRAAAGQARIGPVYTPPGLRGHGYGGAVTAAVTQAALDAGAEGTVLFTDLANPTSNTLYQRLGYRPLSDWALLRFAAPAR